MGGVECAPTLGGASIGPPSKGMGFGVQGLVRPGESRRVEVIILARFFLTVERVIYLGGLLGAPSSRLSGLY